MAHPLRPRLLFACALALSATLSATLSTAARAQSPTGLQAGANPGQSAGEKAAAAQALFDEAMRLMKAGQTTEACPKLEESLRLDAGMATQFRLAECYEKVGRIAGAWASFVAVADAAAVGKLPEREAAARKRADALAPRIPRLTITVPAAVAALDGLEVLRDGVTVARPLWGVSVPVDPGPHVIRARAPGKMAWEGRVDAPEGLALAAAVPELLAAQLILAAPPPPAPPAPRSLIPGLVLGGVAVAAAGVGGGLVGAHLSDLSEAKTLRDEIKATHGTCVAGAPGFDARCSALAAKASSADTLGNASTIALATAGAGAAAAMMYLLWPSAPSAPSAPAVRAAPVIGVGGGGLVFSGSF